MLYLVLFKPTGHLKNQQANCPTSQLPSQLPFQVADPGRFTLPHEGVELRDFRVTPQTGGRGQPAGDFAALGHPTPPEFLGDPGEVRVIAWANGQNWSFDLLMSMDMDDLLRVYLKKCLKQKELPFFSDEKPSEVSAVSESEDTMQKSCLVACEFTLDWLETAEFTPKNCGEDPMSMFEFLEANLQNS